MAEAQESVQHSKLSLSGILDSKNEDMSFPEEQMESLKPEGWDEESGVEARDGYCVECEGKNPTI